MRLLVSETIDCRGAVSGATEVTADVDTVAGTATGAAAGTVSGAGADAGCGVEQATITSAIVAAPASSARINAKRGRRAVIAAIRRSTSDTGSAIAATGIEPPIARSLTSSNSAPYARGSP